MGRNALISYATHENELPSAIVFSPAATRAYQATVAQQPPETCALLGGSPDNPARVSEFRYLPSALDVKGRSGASSSHFSVDARYINHILFDEWAPQGIAFLGYLHSHPNNMTHLSGGGYQNGEPVGDMAAIQDDLARFKGAQGYWHYALMPITTFDVSGQDRVTGWVVRTDDTKPHAVEVIFEHEERLEEMASDSLGTHAARMLDDVSEIQKVIHQVEKQWPRHWTGRWAVLSGLRRMRTNAIKNAVNLAHQRSQLHRAVD